MVDELSSDELAGNQLVEVEVPVADLGSSIATATFDPENGHHLFGVGKFSPPIKLFFDSIVCCGRVKLDDDSFIGRIVERR